MAGSDSLQNTYRHAINTTAAALDSFGPFSASTTLAFLTVFAGLLHLSIHLTFNIIFAVPYGPYQAASLWTTTILTTTGPLLVLGLSSVFEYISSRSAV